ncbi:MAG: NUDIX domain-containing protein [Caldilineaceae bacterium]|nr:NUDIX domain-containing protein [Caldilineaceae bacterium]
MNATEQATRAAGRHLVVPRVLIFLTRTTGAGMQEVLLLKGAPGKRLWANKYNGLGGHVEATEDVYTAARREVKEEAGLDVAALMLRGVVTIDTGFDEHGRRPGVLMFVFTGEAPAQAVSPTREGTPEWVPVAALAEYPLVDDLYALLPRALSGAFFYGHYSPQPDGTLHYAFTPAG